MTDSGLPGAMKRSLERVPIRRRESAATQSAWQMVVDSDLGSGTITLVGDSIYRGEGVFLGWSQAQLAAVYEALNTPPDEPSFELSQLG